MNHAPTNALHTDVIDRCPNCGGDLVGDGYTSVVHCEYVDPDPWLEPDANPVYCNYPDMEDSE